jgi:acetyltransferase-like isoleucine patch superfamily enzyme
MSIGGHPYRTPTMAGNKGSMNKMGRLAYYLRDGSLQGILFERIFKLALTRCTGLLSLFFYRVLFRRLHIGKKTKCWGWTLISKSPLSTISIGDDCWIVSSSLRSTISLFTRVKISVFWDATVSIGNGVALNGTCITCRSTSISIGEGSMCAPNVIIVDSDFHAPWPPENRICNMGYERDSSVEIGRNVWIGMGSMVLKGVTIGDNSIIAAGSVVDTDIPPNVLAGGVPAKVIRELP